MKYRSEYFIPDIDDRGTANRDEYLQVNSVGFYGFDDPGGATHRKRGRSDFFLSYNHGGMIKALSENNIIEIGAGSVLIYRPYEEQYYGQADKEPLENYWVHFTGYGANELLVKSNLAHGNAFDIGVNNEIPVLFDRMMEEISARNHNFEIIAASNLMQIFSILSRKLLSGDLSHQMNERESRLDSIIRFINKNYSGSISVAKMAGMAGLSPNRFSYVFKQYTGLSPQQYLITYRLKKAKELMKHTGLSLKHISSIVGFHDQLYFSRLFKEYEKMTPTQYKAR